jgi:hypothetical protein
VCEVKSEVSQFLGIGSEDVAGSRSRNYVAREDKNPPIKARHELGTYIKQEIIAISMEMYKIELQLHDLQD